jgi:hypothetical protein
VSYVYFIKAERDSATKACRLLQMILLAPTLDVIEPKDTSALQTKMEQADIQGKIVATLTSWCKSGRLKIYFLNEAPSLQYCIHNAKSATMATLYFKRPDGFIKWQQGVDAHNFWTEEARRHGIETANQRKAVTVTARELGDFLNELPGDAVVLLTLHEGCLRLKSGQSQNDLEPMSTIFQGASGFDVTEERFRRYLEQEVRRFFPGIHHKVLDLCFSGLP